MQIILASGNRHKAREIAHLLSPHTVVCYSELIAPFEIAENGGTFAENALIKARAVFAAISESSAAVIGDRPATRIGESSTAAISDHTTANSTTITDHSPFVLADDSGICVDLLGGAPGIFSARYAGENANDSDNLHKLIAEINAQNTNRPSAQNTNHADTQAANDPNAQTANYPNAHNAQTANDPNAHGAHYTAAIALVCGAGEFVSHGWLYGKVLTTPHGTNGFGYDPIFVPNGFDQTLGELPDDTKAAISHRAQAISNIRHQLSVLIR